MEFPSRPSQTSHFFSQHQLHSISPFFIHKEHCFVLWPPTYTSATSIHPFKNISRPSLHLTASATQYKTKQQLANIVNEPPMNHTPVCGGKREEIERYQVGLGLSNPPYCWSTTIMNAHYLKADRTSHFIFILVRVYAVSMAFPYGRVPRRLYS